MAHRWLRYGDRGLLLELPDINAVLAVVAGLRAPSTADPPGSPDSPGPADSADLEDVVPGARTVLLVARPGVDPQRLRSLVRLPSAGADVSDASGVSGAPDAPIALGEEVLIPVVYDGPDLAEVAALTGLEEAAVIAAHTSRPWRVAFGGFAPGFAYLVDGDPRLEVPRRAEPRTSVPAGAVGLAGTFSGIYPRASPGGWQLLGRTGTVMFDLDRDPPALLQPGVSVRFWDAGQR